MVYLTPDTGVPTIFFPNIKKAISSSLNDFLGSTCRVKSNVFGMWCHILRWFPKADGEVKPCGLAAYQHFDKNLSF